MKAVDVAELQRDRQGLIAAAPPLVPPRAWFEVPEPEDVSEGAWTVTADGQVYGYAALWDSCHTGKPGRCVQPPKSASGYGYYMTGLTEVDDGELVPTGRITLGTGHASLTASPAATAEHYDNTGAVAADVRITDGKYGIWVSGALRPDVTPERARTLRGASLSGDWRNIRGKLEMLGLLAVNVPGFPVPRAMHASGEVEGHEEVLALVAAGVIEGAILTPEEATEEVSDEEWDAAFAEMVDVMSHSDDVLPEKDAVQAALESMSAAGGKFEEAKHPRHKKGSKDGGQFAPKSGGATTAKKYETHSERMERLAKPIPVSENDPAGAAKIELNALRKEAVVLAKKLEENLAKGDDLTDAELNEFSRLTERSQENARRVRDAQKRIRQWGGMKAAADEDFTDADDPALQEVERDEAEGEDLTAAAHSKQQKIARVMREFKAGKLKTKEGKKVTSRKQALAVAFSAAGEEALTEEEVLTAARFFDETKHKRHPKGVREGGRFAEKVAALSVGESVDSPGSSVTKHSDRGPGAYEIVDVHGETRYASTPAEAVEQAKLGDQEFAKLDPETRGELPAGWGLEEAHEPMVVDLDAERAKLQKWVDEGKMSSADAHSQLDIAHAAAKRRSDWEKANLEGTNDNLEAEREMWDEIVKNDPGRDDFADKSLEATDRLRSRRREIDRQLREDDNIHESYDRLIAERKKIERALADKARAPARLKASADLPAAKGTPAPKPDAAVPAASLTASIRAEAAVNGEATPDGAIVLRAAYDLPAAITAAATDEQRTWVTVRAVELGLVPDLPAAWDVEALLAGADTPLAEAALTAAFVESQHPRHPEGKTEGGQFAPKGKSASWAKRDEARAGLREDSEARVRAAKEAVAEAAKDTAEAKKPQLRPDEMDPEVVKRMKAEGWKHDAVWGWVDPETVAARKAGVDKQAAERTEYKDNSVESRKESAAKAEAKVVKAKAEAAAYRARIAAEAERKAKDEAARKKRRAVTASVDTLEAVNDTLSAAGTFDSSKHPRHPKGDTRGGEFAPKGGGDAAGDRAKLVPGPGGRMMSRTELNEHLDKERAGTPAAKSDRAAKVARETGQARVKPGDKFQVQIKSGYAESGYTAKVLDGPHPKPETHYGSPNDGRYWRVELDRQPLFHDGTRSAKVTMMHEDQLRKAERGKKYVEESMPIGWPRKVRPGR